MSEGKEGRRTKTLVVLVVGIVGFLAFRRFSSSYGEQGPLPSGETEARPEVPLVGEFRVTPSERTLSHPDDAADVAVAGSIRISDGRSRDSSVPFLGDGALSATRQGQGDEDDLTIPIHEGRFAFNLRSENAIHIARLELGGLPAILEEGQELAPGLENIVFCSWPSMSIRLFVRERGTGHELSRVSIWSVANLLSLDLFGSPAIGPSEPVGESTAEAAEGESGG